MFRACIVASGLALLTFASGCDDKTKATTTTTAAQPTSATTTVVPKNEVPRTTGTDAGHAASTKEPVLTYKGVGLMTPESVLYDAADDVYLVSNIEGKPLDVDAKGFITKLSPDGKVTTLKWIEGGKNKVTLNAPKGLALIGDVLYVADVDTVRMFDRKTGAPVGEVKIPGALFLNDVASTADGHVLVSDTGMKAGAKGMAPAGTDAIYSIDKAKKLTTVAKSKDLANPNGVLSTPDKTWVASGTNELFALDAKGAKTDVQKLPKGSLDGIVALPGGDLLVSSWDAKSVYRGKPGGPFTAVIENVESPADIGYDTKRGRVLVPLFQRDEVQVFDLK